MLDDRDAMYDICIATTEDIPELLALQAQNQVSRGGALSIEFPAVWFEMVVREMPIVIARRDGRLVGYLVLSTPERHQQRAFAATKTCHPVAQATHSGVLSDAGRNVEVADESPQGSCCGCSDEC